MDDECYIGIAMEAEDFGSVNVGKNSLNGKLEVLNRMTIKAIVVLTIRIVVFLSGSSTNKIRVKTLLQGTHQTDTIKIIGDSPTVIDLSYHIPNGIPIDIFTPVVQEVPQCAK